MRSLTAPARAVGLAGSQGEDCPRTVNDAIRQAHVIMAEAGVTVGTAKLSKIARAYVDAGSLCDFRGYLIRSTSSTARSLPGARGQAVEWVDPTGNTAARNVDRERGAAHV